MAVDNSNLTQDFLQTHFHVEIINFFNHIKKSYPNEQENVDNLMSKYLANSNKMINFEKLEDVLVENLSKSKALIAAALTIENYSSLEQDEVFHYFWALETFITNAYDLVVDQKR